MVCCGYCSGVILARSARAGVGSDGRTYGHRIRAAGGRAHWAGNTATELQRGLLGALGVATVGVTRAGALVRVRAGYAVAVSLTYAELPDYLKIQANDFGHCVTLKGHRVTDGVTYVGFFDPLWAQGEQGAWARWTDIGPALWDTGHTSTTVKYSAAAWRLHIAKGATIRQYRLERSGGAACIASWTDRTWSRGASQAPCTAPVSRRTCDGKSSATTVLVTGGAFKDSHLKVDPTLGVTVTPLEA
jgi:hypothetical protein